MVQANQDLDKVLMNFSPKVQSVVQEARSLIYEILPQVVEVVWERQKQWGMVPDQRK